MSPQPQELSQEEVDNLVADALSRDPNGTLDHKLLADRAAVGELVYTMDRIRPLIKRLSYDVISTTVLRKSQPTILQQCVAYSAPLIYAMVNQPKDHAFATQVAVLVTHLAVSEANRETFGDAAPQDTMAVKAHLDDEKRCAEYEDKMRRCIMHNLPEMLGAIFEMSKRDMLSAILASLTATYDVPDWVIDQGGDAIESHLNQQLGPMDEGPLGKE